MLKVARALEDLSCLVQKPRFKAMGIKTLLRYTFG